MNLKQAGGCQAANASASTHTIVMQSQKSTKGVRFEKATGVQGLHPAGDDNHEDEDGLMESTMEWSTTLEGHDPPVLGRGMAHQVELLSRVHTLACTHSRTHPGRAPHVLPLRTIDSVLFFCF